MAWARGKVQDELDAAKWQVDLANTKARRARLWAIAFAVPSLAAVAAATTGLTAWAGYSVLQSQYSLDHLSPAEVCADHDMVPALDFSTGSNFTDACMEPVLLGDDELETWSYNLWFYAQDVDGWWPIPSDALHAFNFIPLVSEGQRARYAQESDDELFREDFRQLEALCALGGGRLIARSGGSLEFDGVFNRKQGWSIQGVESHVEAFTWCQGVIEPGKIFHYAPKARRPYEKCEGEQPEKGEADTRKCSWVVLEDYDNSQHMTVVATNAVLHF